MNLDHVGCVVGVWCVAVAGHVAVAVGHVVVAIGHVVGVVSVDSLHSLLGP